MSEGKSRTDLITEAQYASGMLFEYVDKPSRLAKLLIDLADSLAQSQGEIRKQEAAPEMLSALEATAAFLFESDPCAHCDDPGGACIAKILDPCIPHAKWYATLVLVQDAIAKAKGDAE